MIGSYILEEWDRPDGTHAGMGDDVVVKTTQSS
jgi:hypothetical protein